VSGGISLTSGMLRIKFTPLLTHRAGGETRQIELNFGPLWVVDVSARNNGETLVFGECSLEPRRRRSQVIHKAEEQGLDEQIGEVLVPTEGMKSEIPPQQKKVTAKAYFMPVTMLVHGNVYPDEGYPPDQLDQPC
jgi:hypothetical protein